MSSTSTKSPGGTVLLAGSGDSLVTTAGTWSFGSGALLGDYLLLNGQWVGYGVGTKLEVVNGELYATNSQGKWYEWLGSNWVGTIDPALAMAPAPDGTMALAASNGGLATSAGIWTFGSAAPLGDYLLLNGQWTGYGVGVKLEVANGGTLYAANSQNQWYKWLGSGWASTADPGALALTQVALTVAQNSAATAIGIAAPSDAGYAAAQLSVTVGGLPSDGTVLLADGNSPVTVGQSLSVAQLTGLKFQPTGGLVGQSSTFNYTVKDPAGHSAGGSALLSVTAATMPPATVPAALTVAKNSLATPIGIAAPSDASYGAGQLRVTVGGLPSDGTVLLADGTTAVTVGQSLSVAQLTGLQFLATAGAAGQSSSFSYTVSDPAGLSAGGSATLAIAAGAAVPGAGATAAGLGTLSTPSLPQPAQSGDIVGLRLQNTGATAEASGYVSFGEVFEAGAVKPGDRLVARIDGVNYAAQMDVKSTNADGSVDQAVLTFKAPAIAAGTSLEVMLARGSAAMPSPAAPSPAALLAKGYDVTVALAFHNPDGTVTQDSASAAAALQAALAGGPVSSWLSGPEVNEYDVVTTVDGGKLKVEFDIRAYADGTTSTDVIFDNSWMFDPGKSDLTYDVAINQGGQRVYSYNHVGQYLYSTWHHQVDSAGTVSPNVQYDITYLTAAAALPAYDQSTGVSGAAIQKNAAALDPTRSTGLGSTGPLGIAEVQPAMPMVGARPDLGPQPDWTAQWLLTQDATARTVMMADADAAGGVPWHLTDEHTGTLINGQSYPRFFQDYRNTAKSVWTPQPANGWPVFGSQGDPWHPEAAHLPDLNYVPYLVTGSHYQLEQLQAEANFALLSQVPEYKYNLPYGADPVTPGNNVYLGVASYHNEERAIAWGLRQLAEAAVATPDNDPLKSYFTSELDRTMNGLVEYYITDRMNAKYGDIEGFIMGYGEASGHIVGPWQQGYIVTALAEIAALNLPQASSDAVQMLGYMNNFISGLYTNGQNGYDPWNGTAYYLTIDAPKTGAAYNSWAALQQANAATYSPTASKMGQPYWATDGQGGYAVIAKAALADEITYTQSPQAIQAYGVLLGQIAQIVGSGQAGAIAALQTDPMWNIMPKLPDGQFLPNSQVRIDTSNNNATLTAGAGDWLLIKTGGGTATLSGGSGTTDLLFGGAGPTTLNAGSGNDYLYAGAGPTTFLDNTGNNTMTAGSGADTFTFADLHSGHDTIAGFNPATDTLKIAANLAATLNGNGISTAAQLLAAATVSAGNTILHLGAKDDITLTGIANPAALLPAIALA